MLNPQLTQPPVLDHRLGSRDSQDTPCSARNLIEGLSIYIYRSIQHTQASTITSYDHFTQLKTQIRKQLPGNFKQTSCTLHFHQCPNSPMLCNNNVQ